MLEKLYFINYSVPYNFPQYYLDRNNSKVHSDS